MKKWNKYILNSLLVFLLALQCSGQTETFDIIRYTPPAAWKKESKPGVMNHLQVNATTGSFCVISLYASAPSSGDAMKDFDASWKELVATPFLVSTSPKTEKQPTAEGWEIVAAAAPAKVDGADLYIILTVLSGFGKTVSIRASLNDQTYMTDLSALLETVELDKTKPVAVTSNKPANTNQSATGKFGAMIYAAPKGWSHQLFQDGVVFKPLDLPAGEHLAMQVMQPLNSAGTLEQALMTSFDEAARMYNGTKMNYAGSGTPYQKTESKRSFFGWEYIRCTGGIRIGNNEYPPEFGLDLFLIKINNRFERVAVLKSRKNCGMSRYYADDRRVYKDAIDDFLFSLQFNDGPQPLIGPGNSRSNGIQGLWQGISLSTTFGAGIRYDVFTPVFFSNGQAFFGPHFLSGGLDGLDSRIPPELHRRDWGTYTFSNGKGILKMPYADIPLRMEGDKLVIRANQTDHRFYQLPDVDGARFNGTYTLEAVNGKIPSVTFTGDGRFTDQGAVKVLYHEYIDCINAALLPGSGIYEVKDHTITFHYTDGRKIKIAFLGAEYSRSNPSPATILMSSNEDRLVRQ